MERGTAQGIISDWVTQQDEPFTSRDAFESNDDLENIGTVYAVMNILFNSGEVARKKTDGKGFVFLSASKAPADFERADIATVTDKKEQKPARKQTEKTEISRELQTRKVASNITDDAPRPKEQPKAAIHTALPESFELTLKTPSGLIITITNKRENA